MEPLFRLHSYLLAAGAVAAAVLKRPGAAKVLGAAALADVAGRQLSPEWAALVAGWYPGSAGAAASVAPLRTVEEVRARGIHAVAVRPNEVATQAVQLKTGENVPPATPDCPDAKWHAGLCERKLVGPVCLPGYEENTTFPEATLPGQISTWQRCVPVRVTSAGAAPSAAVLAARNTFDSQWAALTQAQRDARLVSSRSLKGLRPPSRAALAGLLMR